jgi:hypothetical protein
MDGHASRTLRWSAECQASATSGRRTSQLIGAPSVDVYKGWVASPRAVAKLKDPPARKIDGGVNDSNSNSDSS